MEDHVVGTLVSQKLQDARVLTRAEQTLDDAFDLETLEDVFAVQFHALRFSDKGGGGISGRCDIDLEAIYCAFLPQRAIPIWFSFSYQASGYNDDPAYQLELRASATPWPFAAECARQRRGQNRFGDGAQQWTTTEPVQFLSPLMACCSSTFEKEWKRKWSCISSLGTLTTTIEPRAISAERERVAAAESDDPGNCRVVVRIVEPRGRAQSLLRYPRLLLGPDNVTGPLFRGLLDTLGGKVVSGSARAPAAKVLAPRASWSFFVGLVRRCGASTAFQVRL